MVDGLASRWGTTRPLPGEREGFCVWFELDASLDHAAVGPEQADTAPEPTGAADDQFSTPSRSQQYSSRHSLASSTHRASDSQGSTVSNA